MKFIVSICMLFTLFLPGHALAELPRQVKADFAPLTGVVVMPVGDQYLIDLDATAGLAEGDILTLTVPGEKIIHPVTKEILGTLDVVRGYLKVTQIKSGYSYAKLITAQSEPQKGAQVKRFEQVPALFSNPEQNPELAAELQTGLPHLKWLDADSGEVPQLTFSLSGSRLQVKNIEGVSIRTYEYEANRLTARPPQPTATQNTFSVTAEPQAPKSTLNRAVDNLLGAVGIGGKDERLENPGIIRSRQDSGAIWMGPNLDGNPAGIASGDFDGDGQLETAVAMSDHIQILRIVKGELSLVRKIELDGGLHALALDSIDLDRNGSPELYLSANNGTEVRSLVVEYRQGRFEVIASRLPWLFRVVDLPDRGPALIGQLVDTSETVFATPPVLLTRQQDELVATADVAAPQGSFFSFHYFSGDGEAPLIAYISPGDYLNVATARMSRLWESSENFGGSEEFFYNRKEKSNDVVQPVYIQKRLIALPTGEILAARNDGPRILQRYRNFTKSSVSALTWNGFALTESWRTSTQSGYLADFTVADADNDGQPELVMAIKFSTKNLLQTGRSTVVVYELN